MPNWQKASTATAATAAAQTAAAAATSPAEGTSQGESLRIASSAALWELSESRLRL